mmetsp:Transcript_2661/g.6407  ORF Transcript_2661/g.6407 Transcript_2661/m.6407 type:complete len:101 (+) Transcript_2661:1043-1345(+)
MSKGAPTVLRSSRTVCSGDKEGESDALDTGVGYAVEGAEAESPRGTCRLRGVRSEQSPWTLAASEGVVPGNTGCTGTTSLGLGTDAYLVLRWGVAGLALT